jgi:hypothetical protein
LSRCHRLILRHHRHRGRARLAPPPSVGAWVAPALTLPYEWLIGQLEAMHGPASRALAWQLGLYSKTMIFSKGLILQAKLFIDWFGLARARSHRLAGGKSTRKLGSKGGFTPLFSGALFALAITIHYGHPLSSDNRRSLFLDSGVLCPNVVRAWYLIFKTIEKEGLQGGGGDKNRVVRPR